uniref:Integrase catalytic domain-containing protein n=1 Tax=Bracon brevicornis TaxID=1563983 RepID=A0A6V7JH80_9HYME
MEKESTIATKLAENNITWSFIPPRPAHFGGLWEAAVKSMKRHLAIVTQGKVLTFEEYNTLLTNVEAVLNCRPLTPLTNDPNDLSVLTPPYFLIGDSLIQAVQPNLLDVADNKLSR